MNDSFTGTTRMLAAGEEVYWLKSPLSANGKTYAAGTIYIPAKATTRASLDKLAADLGLSFDAVATAPSSDALKTEDDPGRLVDSYGGSMPSGWIRYMLEQQYPTPL